MTHFFSGLAASRCSKACSHKLSRKYSKNWLRRTNIESNLSFRIEYTLKPSNYDAKPWFLHFAAQKSKCPHRFWEIDPILHNCLMCPCRAFHECFSFFAENVGSLQTQISPEKTKTAISDGKKRNKNIRYRLGRGTPNTRAKFQGLTLKNGVDIGIWRNCGFMLEPACIHHKLRVNY